MLCKHSRGQCVTGHSLNIRSLAIGGNGASSPAARGLAVSVLAETSAQIGKSSACPGNFATGGVRYYTAVFQPMIEGAYVSALSAPAAALTWRPQKSPFALLLCPLFR